MNWKYFRYITLPKILWYITGRFLWEEIYDYWWLNIAKKQELWPDADEEGCPRRYCRYCGKGKSK